MSLIHWWPLNGDTRDYGLNNKDLTNSNATSGNSGKIGKCYSFNGSSARLSLSSSETVNYPITICAWIYPTSLPSSQTQYVFSYNTATGGTDGHAVGFGVYGSSSALAVWFKGTVSITSFTMTNNTWYHIALSVDANNNIKVYANGSLVSSLTNSGSRPNSLWFTLGARSNSSTGGVGGAAYYFAGKINDARIYDHALSAKEVKEISKGLVLHYNFEDEYAEGTTNIFPINYQNAFFITGASGNTFNSSGNFSVLTSVHGKYTLSGYYKLAATDTATNPRVTLCAKYSDSSNWVALISSTSIYGYQPKDGQFHYFHITGTTDNSRTLEAICGWVFDYTSAGNARNIECKEIQLELKDHATPYVNGTRQPGLIYDNSGYGRNATPINNPQILQDSGSGLHCVDLTDATKGYYDLGTATFNFITSGTVCFWAKYTDSSNKMILGANDSGAKYLAANTPNGSSSSGNWYGMVSTSNCYCDGEVYSKPKIDSQWHFYCFTGINFSYWGDLKYFLCIYANSLSNSFQFHGYLADFKIYATNLSTSDILAEYNRKASIDRNGNLFTGEFIEEDGNASITKNNIVFSSAFVEGKNKVDILGGYTELEYIESTGTQYINTGATLGSDYEFVLDQEHSFDSGNHYLCGSSSSGKMLGTLNNHIWTNGVIYSTVMADSNIRQVIGTKITITNAGCSYVCTNYTTRAKHSGSVSYTPSGDGETKLFGVGNANESFKCYDCKIFNEGTLVRHFIPAKRNRDNTIGLFDLVECKFYVNSGSGSFIAGPELGELSIICANEVNEL